MNNSGREPFETANRNPLRVAIQSRQKRLSLTLAGARSDCESSLPGDNRKPLVGSSENSLRPLEPTAI